MRSRLAMTSLCFATALVVWGCAEQSGNPPRLHTVDVAATTCAGVGLEDATIHGSASDLRVAWIELKGHGERQALFPSGFTARFSPGLEVLDARGNVVFREGDEITGACGGGADGSLLVGWP